MGHSISRFEFANSRLDFDLKCIYDHNEHMTVNTPVKRQPYGYMCGGYFNGMCS